MELELDGGLPLAEATDRGCIDAKQLRVRSDWLSMQR